VKLRIVLKLMPDTVNAIEGLIGVLINA
jgi:hypothetical protein